MNAPTSRAVTADRAYDPLSEQSHLDPYPAYSWLREHAPVYYYLSKVPASTGNIMPVIYLA